MQEFIVSVMAKDAPGIVAAVSGAIANMGGNITHLSETVLRGYFTIILSVEAPDGLLMDDIRTAVVNSGPPQAYEVGILLFEDNPPASEQGQHFVLTMRCQDQKGLIHRVTSMLAAQSINIDDFYAYIHDNELIMVLDIAVEAETNLPQLQDQLDTLYEERGVKAHLQHTNIFRATTELQAVLRLEDRI